MIQWRSKEKIFLILGIFLPSAIVALAWTQRFIAHHNIPPPQYSFIYAARNYGNFLLKVDSNKIYFEKINRNTASSLPAQLPELYYYNALTHESEKIAFTAKQSDFDKVDRIELIYFPSYSISTNNIAPDGYTFETRYNRNPIASIFGGYQPYFSLTNDGKRVFLKIDPESYSISFLGWLVPEVPNGQ